MNSKIIRLAFELVPIGMEITNPCEWKILREINGFRVYFKARLPNTLDWNLFNRFINFGDLT